MHGGVQEVNGGVQEVKQRSNPTKKEPNKKTTLPNAIAPVKITKSDRDAMFDKIIDITALNPKMKGVGARIGKAINELLEAEFTIHHLNRFGKEIWVDDWRYKKDKRRPTLPELLTEIQKLDAAPLDLDDGKQANRSGDKYGVGRSMDAVKNVVEMIERREEDARARNVADETVRRISDSHDHGGDSGSILGEVVEVRR